MESATQTKMRDDLGEARLAEVIRIDGDRPHGAWSKQELLLATLIDSIAQLTYVQIAKAGVKDVKPPEPVRRPGVAVKPKGPSPAALAYLQNIRDRHDALEGA